MGNWTKRLRDCSIHLDNAINNYLEPDLFRINFNNFMQTARTVTFLIQKEKMNYRRNLILRAGIKITKVSGGLT